MKKNTLREMISGTVHKWIFLFSFVGERSLIMRWGVGLQNGSGVSQVKALLKGEGLLTMIKGGGGRHDMC